MNKLLNAIAAACSLLILSPFAATQEDESTIDEEDAVEEGQQCINSRSIRRTEVLDDQNILFYIRGAAIYLNHLPKTCKRLAQDRRFMYQTSLSRLCRSDLITVLTDSGIGIGTGRSCKLGSFYAISKEDVEDLRTPPKVEPKTIPPAEPEEPGTGETKDNPIALNDRN